TLAEVRVQEGDSAPVGAVIAVLAAPGEGTTARPAAHEKAAPTARAPASAPRAAAPAKAEAGREPFRPTAGRRTEPGESPGARPAASGGGKARRALPHPAHHRQAHGRVEARDPALLRLDRDRDGRGGPPEGSARRARGRVRGPHLHARHPEGGGARAHARARA